VLIWRRPPDSLRSPACFVGIANQFADAGAIKASAKRGEEQVGKRVQLQNGGLGVGRPEVRQSLQAERQ
jgi:hypothetical protein